MRNLSLALLTSLAVFVAGCSDDNAAADGSGGAGGGAGASGRAGAGGRSSTNVEFSDLPGKIRFVNFVSDGTQGVDLDLYWGISVGRGERVATVEYGEITDFLTPRHSDEPVLDPDEARYFLVPKGDVSGSPASFLVQDDPTFAADTVLTIALAAAKNVSGDTLTVSAQTIHERDLTTPPAGKAHVYGYSSAFSQIAGGNFVLVGSSDTCAPDLGEPGGANLGFPAVFPAGTTELSLFDANTEPPCSTSATPVTQDLVAGHSYVLLGEAKTYDLDARRTVLLEVGTE
jgi:hypothetical protein